MSTSPASPPTAPRIGTFTSDTMLVPGGSDGNSDGSTARVTKGYASTSKPWPDEFASRPEAAVPRLSSSQRARNEGSVVLTASMNVASACSAVICAMYNGSCLAVRVAASMAAVRSAS